MVQSQVGSEPIASGITALAGALLRLWPREASLTTDLVLSHLQRGGPMRVTELANAAGVSQPSMTELVARQVEAGTLERRRHAGDGRVVLVALTAAGAATLQRRREATTARLSTLVADLSPDEVGAIDAALPALHRVAVLVDEELARPAW